MNRSSRALCALRGVALGFALALALALTPALVADEGMWMPQQVPDLAPRLRSLGFSGDPHSFADLAGFPMGAVVSLGGCSASFVSPEGLVVTNHHCVQGSLQYNSTPQRNLFEDGFLARTRDEELWNGPGSRVTVTVSVREVTDEIVGKPDAKATDRQRFDAIERRVKERTAACEKDGLRCRVVSFFEGLKWYEIAQQELNDVRLVYAPPRGIGNFGGETDNWQWPRHTGDWSFYRAYVGKDGKPAAFSKENVPYRPKHFLKVSPRGAEPGSLVVVAGYPGRTYRHETWSEVKERVDWALPGSIRRSRELLVLLDETTKGDKALEIKAEPTKRRLNNGLTKNVGVLDGLVKGGLLAQKEKQERELEGWIASDARRKADWGDVLPGLRAIQAEGEKVRDRNQVLSSLYGPSSLLSVASGLYRLSLEKPKKDADRETEFQERNWSRQKEASERMQKTFDPRLDRAFLRYTLLEAAALPAGQRIEAVDAAAGLSPGLPKEDAAKRIDAWLDGLYAGTKLGERDFRIGLFDATAAQLAASKDSFVALAVALHPLAEANRDRVKETNGAYSRLRPRHMKALLTKEGGLVAPDANSTLRVTFGTVKGVSPRDGMYHLPQTTLQGVLEKATGKGDFDAPQRELDAIRALRAGKKTPYLDPKLADVPVDFLSDVDTTGGNSGSAVLNGKSELVGLLFDGTFDTLASDFLFDKARTRSIQVDSRYMLWTMTEVDGALHLVEEMGIR